MPAVPSDHHAISIHMAYVIDENKNKTHVLIIYNFNPIKFLKYHAQAVIQLLFLLIFYFGCNSESSSKSVEVRIIKTKVPYTQVIFVTGDVPKQ